MESKGPWLWWVTMKPIHKHLNSKLWNLKWDLKDCYGNCKIGILKPIY